LGHYEHGWATLEIIRTINKNKHNYNKKIGRSSSAKETVDDDGVDGGQEGGNEEEGGNEFSDSDEEVTNGARKRGKAVQGGGISKKART
jgi:hypothetical protein